MALFARTSEHAALGDTMAALAAKHTPREIINALTEALADRILLTTYDEELDETTRGTQVSALRNNVSTLRALPAMLAPQLGD